MIQQGHKRLGGGLLIWIYRAIQAIRNLMYNDSHLSSLAMARGHGLRVISTHVEESRVTIKSRHMDITTVTKILSDSSKKRFCVTKGPVSHEDAYELLQSYGDYGTETLIVTTGSVSDIDAESEPHGAFHVSRIALMHTISILAPKMRKMEASRIAAIKSSHMDLAMLPRMGHTEPLCEWYGLVEGDIVEVILGDSVVDYRIVASNVEGTL